MTIKIDALVEEIPRTIEYGNVFVREGVGGRDRLRVGLNEAQDTCVRTLASTLSGPFQLFYVLHTTRTGAELGRYESPEVTRAGVEEFSTSSAGTSARIHGTICGSVRMTTMRQSSWIATMSFTHTGRSTHSKRRCDLGVRVEASQRCLVLTCIITMLRGMKRSDRSCALLSGTLSRYVRPTCNSTLRATIDGSLVDAAHVRWRTDDPSRRAGR
jgi:hypothetical protein